MISLYFSALLCTLQHIIIHAMQLSGVSSRIDTAELHRVCDNMLQRAQKCIEVQ